MTFVILNSLLRVLLTLFISYKLINYGDMLNFPERLGMGMMGGASFLTIALINDTQHDGTPFDGWATTVLTMGALVYFGGRLSRHIRHRRNNLRAAAQAAAHMRDRGRP